MLLTKIKQRLRLGMLILLGMGMLFCSIRPASAAQIKSFRIGQGIGNVRIVLDADAKFDYKVFLLTEPKRLVIDTQNIDISSKIEKMLEANSFVSGMRLGTVGVNGARIVLDLQKPAVIKKVFMLPPQSNFSWRFVIDLEAASEREFVSKVGNDNAFSNDSYNARSGNVVTAAKTPSSPSQPLKKNNKSKWVHHI